MYVPCKAEQPLQRVPMSDKSKTDLCLNTLLQGFLHSVYCIFYLNLFYQLL